MKIKPRKGFAFIEFMLLSIIMIGVSSYLLSDTSNQSQKNSVSRHHVVHSITVPNDGFEIKRIFRVEHQKLSVIRTSDRCALGQGDLINSVAQFSNDSGGEIQFLYKANSKYKGENRCGDGEFYLVTNIKGLSIKPSSANFHESPKPLKLLPYEPSESSILSEALLVESK
jgi:hypothetical protein